MCCGVDKKTKLAAVTCWNKILQLIWFKWRHFLTLFYIPCADVCVCDLFHLIWPLFRLSGISAVNRQNRHHSSGCIISPQGSAYCAVLLDVKLTLQWSCRDGPAVPRASPCSRFTGLVPLPVKMTRCLRCGVSLAALRFSRRERRLTRKFDRTQLSLVTFPWSPCKVGLRPRLVLNVGAAVSEICLTQGLCSLTYSGSVCSKTRIK